LEDYNGSGDPNLRVIKGFALMLSPSTAPVADALLIDILRQKSNHIPALIGRGCLAFNRQDYIGSLGYFKSVLMTDPGGPTDVRVGIAHCFWKMGDLKSARLSFEIALEHNSTCQNALLGKAILNLNERDPKHYKEGINLLSVAFDINKRHPVALSILATYYYSIGDHEMALRLAGNAIGFTDIPHLKSHSFYQVARSQHAIGEYEYARMYYQNAVDSAPEGYVLPQLGLAQMYLREGESDKAKICLETFLKSLPNESTAMRLLAKIYIDERSPGQIEKAIEMLIKVVEKPSGRQDWDSWLSLALAYQQNGLWNSATNAYEKAIAIYMDQGLQIPVVWLSNQAVSQMSAKEPKKAFLTLNEAFTKMKSQGDNPHNSTIYLTMRYNYARVLEARRMYDLAQTLYENIIASYPNYHDCHLRLGLMAMQLGKLNKALEHFKEVLAIEHDNIGAR